jgi:transcriptional regulator with XRE-family HTH domain
MLAARVKVLRKTLGLTQTEFAEKVGMTLRGVQKWEHGDTDLKESSLRLIEATFNFSPLWLRDGIGDMFSAGESVVDNVNLDAFAALWDLIEEYVQVKKGRLATNIKAKVVFRLYQYYMSQYLSQSNENNVVSLTEFIRKNAKWDIAEQIKGEIA